VLLPFKPPSRPAPLNATPSTAIAPTLYIGARLTKLVAAAGATTVSVSFALWLSVPETPVSVTA